MRMEHKVSDGMVENLKGMAKIVRPSEAVITGIVTGIKLFDEKLSPADRILLDQAVNIGGLVDFETVQRYLESGSDEDSAALEVAVNDFRFCADKEAKEAALKNIVKKISVM